MVSKHNEDAQSCAQQGELLKEQWRLVGGEIDEVAGDCDEISVDRAHGVDGLREPLRAEKVAEVDVGDVRDALAGLGYSAEEIRDVLREINVGTDPELMLREALNMLGARRA